VAYFGPRGRTAARLRGARPLLGVDRARITGWVAASATLVTGQGDRLGWLRAYCPVGSIDGSVLLYRFRSPPVGRAPRSEPRGYCARGTTSS
jgi:hypothetical protein